MGLVKVLAGLVIGAVWIFAMITLGLLAWKVMRFAWS